MSRPAMLRRLLLAPPSLRTSLIQPRIIHPAVASQRGYAAIPSITQPSFWMSMIPKPLRKDASSKSATKKPKSKEWNPATFFIFIFLLIGSMSIQMIALRNEFTAFSRRSDARIGLLKEIIERIQKGEEVDVEGLLGTGDTKREQEWEEVLQEIEREDEAWEQSRKPKPKHGQNLEKSKDATAAKADSQPAKPDKKSNAPSGFF